MIPRCSSRHILTLTLYVAAILPAALQVLQQWRLAGYLPALVGVGCHQSDIQSNSFSPLILGIGALLRQQTGATLSPMQAYFTYPHGRLRLTVQSYARER